MSKKPQEEKDPDFLNVDDIIQVVINHVADNLAGEWPEDYYLEIGSWDANIWLDETGLWITVSPIDARGNTDTSRGIRICATDYFLPGPDLGRCERDLEEAKLSSQRLDIAEEADPGDCYDSDLWD